MNVQNHASFSPAGLLPKCQPHFNSSWTGSEMKSLVLPPSSPLMRWRVRAKWACPRSWTRPCPSWQTFCAKTNAPSRSRLSNAWTVFSRALQGSIVMVLIVWAYAQSDCMVQIFSFWLQPYRPIIHNYYVAFRYWFRTQRRRFALIVEE